MVRWALRKAGVEECLVELVMCLYDGAKTAVQTDDGSSKWLDVEAGLHQGSALSPLLFIIVMEEVSRDIRVGMPWELLYVDDLVPFAESEEKGEMKNWKVMMEVKGRKVNLAKTKMMWMGSGKDHMDIGIRKVSRCGRGVGNNSILCGRCN
jgi:Reverse transcriptase (RNA-dependent DNA polymerase)